MLQRGWLTDGLGKEKVKAASSQPYSSYFSLLLLPFFWKPSRKAHPADHWSDFVTSWDVSVRTHFLPLHERQIASPLQPTRIWEQVGLLRDTRPTVLFSANGYWAEICSLRSADNQKDRGPLRRSEIKTIAVQHKTEHHNLNPRGHKVPSINLTNLKNGSI